MYDWGNPSWQQYWTGRKGNNNQKPAAAELCGFLQKCSRIVTIERPTNPEFSNQRHIVKTLLMSSRGFVFLHQTSPGDSLTYLETSQLELFSHLCGETYNPPLPLIWHHPTVTGPPMEDQFITIALPRSSQPLGSLESILAGKALKHPLPYTVGTEAAHFLKWTLMMQEN